MNQPPTEPTFEDAVALHQAGRLQEASAAYSALLAVNPNQAHVWQMLGALHFQIQAFGEAERFFLKAAELEPDEARHHNNLGALYRQLGRTDEAVARFQTALAVNPDIATAQAQVGALLVAQGRLIEAVEHLQKAVALDPNLAKPWVDLVAPLGHLGRFDEAFEALRRSGEVDPATAAVYAPDHHHQLALALAAYGRDDEAIFHAERSVELRPEPKDRLALLGEAFTAMGLGNQHNGRLDRAVRWFEKALELNPDSLEANSKLFWCLQYSGEHSEDDAAQRAFEWGRRLQDSLSQAGQTLHRWGGGGINEAEKGRRMRIGYLSPEFRDHPVAYCFEPLLAAHDSDRFETFLYSSTRRPDATTGRLKASADHWRDILSVPDDQGADLIRQDRIDILVDLAGHTENNRAGVLARKPAAIQAEWLGYYATTGLPQVDYFICSRHLLPESEERLFVERPMRLEGRFHAYGPPAEDIPVTPLPALKNGFVTFGCDNYLAKVGPEVVKLWSQVLHAVPGSRFEMNRHAFIRPEVREHFTRLFADNGVDPARLSFISTHTRTEYLKGLGRLDIFLDTFPFNGYTSVFEALWMGIPVVSMSAPRMAGHFAESLLIPFGRPEWAAATPEEYVAAAAALCSDVAALAEVRAGMRERFLNSPLCDAASFAREIEGAYEKMFSEVFGQA